MNWCRTEVWLTPARPPKVCKPELLLFPGPGLKAVSALVRYGDPLLGEGPANAVLPLGVAVEIRGKRGRVYFSWDNK